MKKIIFILLVMTIIILLVAVGVFVKDRGQSLGSILESQEYNATSTPWNNINSSHYLKKGRGSLGSVIITKAGDTEFYLLNATNTPEMVDAYATSTDMIAHFPANIAVGTYVFDTFFNNGLYFYVVGGNTGTSTITFR